MSIPTLRAERLSGLVLAVVGRGIFDLASCDLHDVDGVADYVGGQLSLLGPLGSAFSGMITDKDADLLVKLNSLIFIKDRKSFLRDLLTLTLW